MPVIPLSVLIKSLGASMKTVNCFLISRGHCSRRRVLAIVLQRDTGRYTLLPPRFYKWIHKFARYFALLSRANARLHFPPAR